MRPIEEHAFKILMLISVLICKCRARKLNNDVPPPIKEGRGIFSGRYYFMLHRRYTLSLFWIVAVPQLG